MTKISFVEPGGCTHTVDAKEGLSVMQVAVNNMVPGINADCGGGCACATCHVYVDDVWREVVGSPNVMEDTMLEFTMDRRDNSRLSCQITVCSELDGLHLWLPVNGVD